MNTFLLYIHLFVLGFIAWNVIKADHIGFNWMKGKTRVLSREIVTKYHHRILFGLTLMLITGFCMFWPMREFLLSRPQLYVKMFFIVTLILNSFAISYFQKIACTKAFSALSTREKIPLLLSGGISTLAWIGAIGGGLYLLPD